MNMRKTRIAVLFGGASTEYPVSLQSAAAVVSHLDQYLYDIVLIGITKDGEWFRFFGSVDEIENDTWHTSNQKVRAIISPDRVTGGLMEFHEDGARETKLDVAFPVMHGKHGEDGTVQGLLELAGIPVVGCGVLPSAVCMDKDLAHKIVKMAGLRVPSSIVVDRETPLLEIHNWASEQGYPLYVKPVRSGSSFGITRVTDDGDLSDAISQALSHDSRVIIEEEISGFEVGCAVMGNKKLVVGELDEIELEKGFFDYIEKYSLKTSKIHLPARIDENLTEIVKEAAKDIYLALGCKGFARVDLFITKDKEIVFNEVNTIPGFTAHSRFPSMMQMRGLKFGEILDELIGLAV